MSCHHKWAKVGEDFVCTECEMVYDPDYIEPPSTGDANSDEAAGAIAPTSKQKRETVFQLLAREGPRAEFQIEKILGWPGNTVRPRLWELVKQERITKGPEKVKTPSGRSAWLYRVVRVGLRDI